MKIRCNTCEHLNDRLCDINKISVSPNKSRICAYYSYREVIRTKHKPLPVTQAPVESLGKSKPIHRKAMANAPSHTNPHPLTGDLSRFIKSSAVKKGD